MSNYNVFSFLVGRNVRTVVATNLEHRVRQFLDTYDPDYFSTVASALLDRFNSVPENSLGTKNRLAAGILVTYNQAIEAFLALLFAVFQAPQCPIAWLLQYHRSDLIELINCVENNSHVDIFRILPDGPEWEGIARTINLIEGTAEVSRETVTGSYSSFWRNLAREYCDERYYDEYNSIKHGNRVQLGGFQVEIGISPHAMHRLETSDYGTTIQRRKLLTNTPKKAKKNVFGLRETHFNWEPRRIVRRTELIRDSMFNTLQFLRGVRLGNLNQVEFTFDNEPGVFIEAGARGLGVHYMDIDSDIQFEPAFMPDREAVRKEYQEGKIMVRRKNETKRE